MKLTQELKTAIDKCVLCWLATVSADNIPNVSPKEVFTHYGADKIIVANIASPQTVKNIQSNQNICISFIDILVQKGYQVKGIARIVNALDAEYSDLENVLLQMTKGKYPFKTITEISVQKIKPIIAPSYLLYPDTTEAQQIASARKVYGI